MYEVITHPEAMDQLAEMPHAALSGYAAAFDVLELVPHNGRLYNEDKPDGMRELVFGEGNGTVTYLILEHIRQVHVLLVQWVGDD